MKKIYINENSVPSLILEAMNINDIYQKYYSDIPRSVYTDIVVTIDPTFDPVTQKMGKYAKWMLGMFRKGTLKQGDFNEARVLLTVFEKYKNRVSVRDVTQLHSMGELYNVVKPFMEGDQATSKSDAIRRSKQGAEKVYEDEQWVVIIPHTMEAAQIYGEHTRWCTAAEDPEDNMFEYYNDQGPLYINIRKDKQYKYQFHFESSSFMDEEDDEIQKPVLETIGATQGLVNFYKQRVGGIDFIKVYGDFEMDGTQENVLNQYEKYRSHGHTDLQLPEVYLVWDAECGGGEKQKCAYINSNGDVISMWFDGAEPFKPYSDGDAHANRAKVFIYADNDESIYRNDLTLYGTAVFNNNQVWVESWEDYDGNSYEPDWYEDGSKHGAYIVYSDNEEDYEEDYDERYLRTESVEHKMSFFTFFNEVKKFISGLLSDPVNTKPSQELINRGLHNGKLRKLLRDANVITMKERIDEPPNEETGEIESRYYISYKVPKKDFKKKIRRLYQRLFEVNESYHTPNGLMLHDNELGNNIDERGEIDMMLNSPLTMGIACDERVPQYVKDAAKIYNDKIIDKKLHNK